MIPNRSAVFSFKVQAWLNAIAVLAAIVAPLSAYTAPAQADFFVAPVGADANPGSADKPFATLSRARDAIREKLRAGNGRDLLVLLRAGTYVLPEPLVFGPEDSGSQTQSIVYAAYPGEKPVLSGGRLLGDWQKTSSQVWTSKLPPSLSGPPGFRSLFIAGRRATRARLPNRHEANPYFRLHDATITSQTGTVSVEPGQLPALRDPTEVEMVILGNWDITRKRLESLDPTTGRVVLAPPYCQGNSGVRPRAGMAYYLENARDFLDEPGEWYLDPQQALLHYWPLSEDNMAKAHGVAPVLTNLVRIAGTSEHPVENLHFRGLTFAHTEWPLPAQGYNGVQAGTFFNAGENADPDNGWSGRMGAAIEFEYAHACSLEDTELTHLGGVAMSVREGCRDNVIQHSHIWDVGGDGIMVGEDWHAIYDTGAQPPGAAAVPTHNRVVDNHIHDCGVDYPGAAAVWISFTEATTVAHNVIHALPYSGVSVGWLWGTKPTACRSNLIEYNHLFDVMKTLADGGGIYTLGLQPGTVLRGNLIHDVQRSTAAIGGAPNNGIFIDEGSQGFLFESNVIHHTSGESIRFNANQKSDHTWHGNSYGVDPKAADFPATATVESGFTNDSTRWETEIRKLEAAEPVRNMANDGILFIGSSSIRMWKSLAADFTGLNVLGRGFGGSQIVDSTVFLKRIVVPYQPKTVILYAGDNDVANWRAPEQVLGDFQNFVGALRASLPQTRIGYIAIKPSLARWQLIDQIKQANALIRQYCSRDPQLQFLDVFSPMLTEAGKPKPELFEADGLHLNQKGYALWAKVIRPYLE